MDFIFDFILLACMATLTVLAVSGVAMVFGLATSQKEWLLEIDGHVLRIENTNLRETLYVDGEIQDQNVGYFAVRSRLTGRLPDGREIKANVGMGFRYHCTIFIDNRLVLAA